jgi:hypothetical protein
MAVMEQRITAEEIGKRGEALYNAGIREEVETPDNLGKFLAIDLDTGHYELDGDIHAAVDRGLEANPDGLFYFVRVGCDAVYELGFPCPDGL